MDIITVAQLAIGALLAIIALIWFAPKGRTSGSTGRFTPRTSEAERWNERR